MSFMIRPELAADAAARERLLDQAFGTRRHAKTSARLRAHRLPAEGLAFTAVTESGKLVGTLRLWNIMAGSAGPALLLGPLAIDRRMRGQGIGRAMMEHALGRARALGHGAVLLVGDAPYYARHGFRQELTASLSLPGPVEPARFLGLELSPGALAGAAGMVLAAGALAPGAYSVPGSHDAHGGPGPHGGAGRKAA